jgi:hypothetical protein
VHFGLGEGVSRVDQVEIRWPSGVVDIFEAVASDTYYRATEGGGLEPL